METKINLDEIELLENQQQEIAEKLAALKAQRKKEVVDEVNRLIRAFNLTASDLDLPKPEMRAQRGSNAASDKPKRKAKYRYYDSATGKEWAGIGPKPQWLKEHANPESLKIANEGLK